MSESRNWIVGDEVTLRVPGHEYEVPFLSVDDPSLSAGGGIALVHKKHGHRAAQIAATPDLLAAIEFAFLHTRGIIAIDKQGQDRLTEARDRLNLAMVNAGHDWKPAAAALGDAKGGAA